MAFAASMVTHNNRGTGLDRSDDFRSTGLTRTATHLPLPPLRTLESHSIDYDATGSISLPEAKHGMHRPGAGLNPVKAPSTVQSENYVLSFVYRNMALVNSKHGFYTAKLGTALPGAGHVLSIERRGHKWVLVTERTVIAETN
jgi:hypothetical protein